MAYLVLMERTGPAWDPALPMEQQSDWTAHAAYLDELVDSGFVRLGGPLVDERRVVLAVDAESEEAVRGTLARDPWVGSHLVITSVEAWTIRLGG